MGKNNKPAENIVPEIKPEYVEAFIHLMLHKLGGFQTITLKQLEKFPKCEAAKIFWDEDKQAFTIKIRNVKLPKRVIRRNRKIITPN